MCSPCPQIGVGLKNSGQPDALQATQLHKTIKPKPPVIINTLENLNISTIF